MAECRMGRSPHGTGYVLGLDVRHLGDQRADLPSMTAVRYGVTCSDWSLYPLRHLPQEGVRGVPGVEGCSVY